MGATMSIARLSDMSRPNDAKATITAAAATTAQQQKQQIPAYAPDGVVIPKIVLCASPEHYESEKRRVQAEMAERWAVAQVCAVAQHFATMGSMSMSTIPTVPVVSSALALNMAAKWGKQ